MTSNRSFFKLQRELIRRNLILPVLSGVGFFFALPLFTLMILQNHISSQLGYVALAELKDYISSVATDFLLSEMQYGAKFGIIIMASLAAFILFRYLHSSKQIDFFHSLPISRGNLFVQLYLTGFISVIPFYVIMYLAAVICAFAMGAGLYITAGLIFKTLAVNIIYFLLFYSLAILAVILSGNTFISACIYAILNFAVPVTCYMLSGLCELTLDTYIISQPLEHIAEKCFPLSSYFIGRNEIRTVSTLIGVFVVSIVLSVLSKVLFTIRKSERAGSALSFYKTKAPLKCYLVLMCGYGFMFMFISIASRSWGYIGILFGVILAHAVFEALYNFDIRSLFKNWKTMIALLVVAFGFFAFLKADIFGYDKKIPNEADISSVSFNASYPNGGYNGFLNTSNGLTDKQNISTVLKLAQYGVDNLDNELYNDTDVVEDENNTSIDIFYALKNGSRMCRSYYVPITDEYTGYLDDIIFTEDYIKNEGNSIFDFNVDNLKFAEINIRTQAATSSDISGTIIDLKKSTEIIKTLREERLTLTKEQAKTNIPVLRLDIDVSYIHDEEDYMTGSSIQYVPVYSTYTKTLALIYKYANVKPEPLTIDKISSMQISIDDIVTSDKLSDETRKKIEDLLIKNPEGVSVYVDDVEIMSKILENAILSEVGDSTHTVFKFDNKYPFSIQVNFKNNAQSHLVYPDGKFPIELLANIVLGNQ